MSGNDWLRNSLGMAGIKGRVESNDMARDWLSAKEKRIGRKIADQLDGLNPMEAKAVMGSVQSVFDPLPGLGSPLRKGPSFIAPAQPQQSLKELRQRMANNRRERAIAEEELARIDRYRRATDAMEKFIFSASPAQAADVLATPVPELRRIVYRTMRDAPHQTGLQNKIKEWSSAHWIDFRLLGFDDHMAKMGEEILSSGIIGLPFPECIFVLKNDLQDRHSMPVAILSSLGEDHKIRMREGFAFSGYPLATDMDFSIADDEEIKAVYRSIGSRIFHGLAVMNTKYFIRERATLSGQPEKRAIPTNPATHYFTVKIKARYAEAIGLGGTHAPPRLHWRRGHIRRLESGRQAWVRPHLVGSAEGGVIVHDYQA